MAYTAQSVAAYLERANRDFYGRRTWAQQFGNVDFSKQMAVEDLKTDYGAAVGSAYDTAFGNETAIRMSNLIQGNKEAALLENDLALQEAYDAYLKNYQSGYQTLSDTASEQAATINAELLKQGEMYSKYATSHIDYLYDLWDKYQNGEIEGTFFSDPRFSNYMKYQYDDTGNILLDENGDPSLTIVDRGELGNIIFDAQGNLTLPGRAFFEQMEYDELLRGNSFSSYLSEADNELYQWALSDNPYDWAPNAAGVNTMAGTFNKLTGRESMDELFEGADAFAGLTEGSTQRVFGEFNDAYEKLLSAKNESQSDYENAANEFADEITKIVEMFNLDDELKMALRESNAEYDSISEFVKDVIENRNEGLNASYDNVTNINTFGAGAGAAIGAFGGPIGVGIGMFLGSLLLGVTEYVATEANRDAIKDKASSSFSQLITNLVNYASNKQGEIQKNFYDREIAKGSYITPYDPLTAKGTLTYDYGLRDGKSATFLSSATLGGNVRNTNHDNFDINFNGSKYNLEVGSKQLDVKTVEQLASKVQNSMGRPLQTGDVFFYDGGLWVVTDRSTIRSVKNQFGKSDYDKLVNDIKINI